MTPHAEFLATVEAYLEAAPISASAFGTATVGDPSFVKDVREGRCPNLRLVEKVEKYIKRNPPRSRKRRAA